MSKGARADRQDRDEDDPPVGGGTIWARVMGAKVPPRHAPERGPTLDDQAAGADEATGSGNA